MRNFLKWWSGSAPIFAPGDVGLASLDDSEFEALLDRMRAAGNTPSEIDTFTRIRDFRRERAFVIKNSKTRTKGQLT
jgi:hypothetical protein